MCVRVFLEKKYTSEIYESFLETLTSWVCRNAFRFVRACALTLVWMCSLQTERAHGQFHNLTYLIIVTMFMLKRKIKKSVYQNLDLLSAEIKIGVFGC